MSHTAHNTTLVSVIMPAYNASATISDSINSVLAQTYANWELLVVDDASTDDTVALVKGYADQRIHLHLNPANLGVALTRNAAISNARGKYLAFLDSDDMWLPSKLEKQLEFMEQKKATISFTGTYYIDATGKPSHYVLHAEEVFTYKQLLCRNIMSCSSIMVQTDCMILFSQGSIHEDYVSWLQLIKIAGQAYGLNEQLLIYRMGVETKSSNRLKSMQMIYKSYRHVGYRFVLSCFFTLRYAKHSIIKRHMIKMGYK